VSQIGGFISQWLPHFAFHGQVLKRHRELDAR